jgi:hypothetical protein
MAKKRLKLRDKKGNVIDYDISAASITIDAEGKQLDIKLTELVNAIEERIKSVTFNGSEKNPDQQGKISISQEQSSWNESNPKNPAYIQGKPNSVVNEVLYDQQSRKVRQRRNGVVEDVFTLPEGGSTMVPDTSMSDTSENVVQNKVIKAYIDAVSQRLNTLIGSNNVQGAIDTFNEVKAFLNGIDTSDPTLANQLLALNNAISALQNTLSTKANSSDLVNYATKSELNGKLSKSDVSVETQGDGTVDINVGSGADKDTYTVNLNHTHENMAKLIVCEESDLPSTLDPATIYAITDSGETEIEKLIIRGMEFAGGGVPDTGEPMISSPSNGSTINLGTNAGSGVSKTITVKGKNLTGDLTVAVGTGLTISYGQVMDGSSVTIPMAQALLGAQVTIAYSGTGALDDGSLVISHGGSVLSSVVVVVVENWVEIDLTQNQVDAWIDASGKWSSSTSSNTQICSMVDAENINKIKITANSTNKAFFLFLKDVPNFPTRVAYATYLCNGESGRREQTAGSTEEYNIPSDCVKVMVGIQAASTGNGPNAYKPQYVGVK